MHLFRRILVSSILLGATAGCSVLKPKGPEEPVAPAAPAVVPAPVVAEPPPVVDPYVRFAERLPQPEGEMAMQSFRGSQGTLLLRVSGDAAFARNGAAPSPVLKRWVERLAREAAALPGASIYIEGHSDRRGSATASLQLSRARAEAIARLLVAGGVPRAQITTGGKGGSIPVASNESEAGRAMNRRVDIVVTRGLSTLGSALASSR